MKVLILGSNKSDSMENHLSDAFIHTFSYDVRILDIYDSWIYQNKNLSKYSRAIDQTLRKYNDSYDQRRFLKLIGKIEEFNPDLIIGVYKDIHPILIQKLRNTNRRIIHINPDSIANFGNQQIMASKYDAYFTKDPFIVNFFKNNLKFNAFYYNEAFNHRLNPKPIISKADCEELVKIDLTTYGTIYPYRAIMLNHIINSGLNMKIFGKKSNRFFLNDISNAYTGKYIIGEEKAKILYGSKIVINTLLYSEIESMNCRFFETNGCGAFQLCDYRPILHNLLPIDPELVSYRSINECIDKAKYYLEHSNERYELSNIIYNHFISHYTYDHLVTYIMEKIKAI